MHYFLDIDTDLHPKEKVIEYLQEQYGQMSVCQISNFSYITPGVAIKDVVRILDKSQERFKKYGKTIGTKKSFEIAKLFNDKVWENCIAANEAAIKKYSDEIYVDLFRIAKELSGRVRHVSIHAGGVGIVGTEITDYMPMRLTDKGEHVIQVDKHVVEDIGIVKFDLLGLRTLSIIKDTLDIGNIPHWEIDPNNQDFLHDEKMYELIGNGDTTNIFQLESQGMSILCRKIKPKSLEEASDVLALYRPDVIQAGMLDDYVDRKVNGTKVKYIHPDMEKILGRTFGVQVYQEQSMQITRTFGGWQMSQADSLRKLLGKKLVDKIKPAVDKLRKDIIANGYSQEVSDYIGNIMEGFGNYSFNQSHSMGYAVIALQTAYLKAHYPVAFYCAVLNSCDNDNGKINKYIIEAQNHGVEVLPPHINKSGIKFSVVDGKILFGLGAVNSIGGVLVDKLVEERNNNGQFTGILNLCERVSALSVAQIVMLIKAGAFGQKKYDLLSAFLKYTAKQKCAGEYKEYKPVKTTPTLLVLKTQYGIDTSDKEERLRLYNEAKKIEHETTKYEEWKKEKKKKMKAEFSELWKKYSDNEEYWEFEAISIFLSNNPFKEIFSYIKRPFPDVETGEEFFDVGIISKIQKKKDKNKRTYCYMNIYSYSGIIEGLCFSTLYDRKSALITKGMKVAVFGEKSGDDTFVMKDIETIDGWMERVNIRL